MGKLIGKGKVWPLKGFRDLVRRHPRYALPSAKPEQEKLTDNLFKTLQQVNYDVNEEITYEKEWSDFWNPAPVVKKVWGYLSKRWRTIRFGDCEDYAIVKRDRLLVRGVKPGAIRFTAVKIDGEGHLVLSVETDVHTFILDNRFDYVAPCDDDRFRNVVWHSRQVPGDWFWEKL